MKDSSLLLYTVVVVLVGLSGTYMVAQSTDSASVPISELSPGMSGSILEAEGMVSEVSSTGSGAWVVFKDPVTGDELEVFVEDGSILQEKGLMPGSIWKVRGELMVEEGGYSMYLDSPDPLVLVKKSSENYVPTSNLCNAPDLFLGMEVATRGTVFAFYEGRVDNTGYVSFSDESVNYSLQFRTSEVVQEGAYVELSGTFEYDSLSARYYLDVRSLSSSPPQLN